MLKPDLFGGTLFGWRSVARTFGQTLKLVYCSVNQGRIVEPPVFVSGQRSKPPMRDAVVSCKIDGPKMFSQ